MKDTKQKVSYKIDVAYALMAWAKQMQQTNNKAFLPLFAENKRFLVLMGGAGSGKSIFAGRKILERCATESGHRMLVCRKVAKTLRQSCFEQLRNQAMTHYASSVAKIYTGDMKITFKSGSVILFAGIDDVEKLKSIYELTGMWIEEASEISEADFNQLNIRMRGKTIIYKQVIVTFNPISITHWLKKRFWDRKDPRAKTHHSTYLDNPFLEEEDRVTLNDFKDTDPYYYAVYCLGQWGVVGKTVFHGPTIQKRLQERAEPLAVGSFTYDYDGANISNIKWVEDCQQGIVKIYETPQGGYPYVIGGDTAGDGSDSFVGQCINNVSGKQAAVLRHQTDEDLYARQMYCLGKHYNNAMLAIEINYSSHPQKELERLGYGNFYVREREDTYSHTITKSFGFITGKLSRPSAIATLIGIMRESSEVINDLDTLTEMATFVRSDSYRAEAEGGAHDDCIMALAIAYYCRLQQRTTPIMPRQAKAVWRADMLEDYQNADSATKGRMLQRFGNPFG